ncbi:hypothetical protein CM49_05939 [Paenibacillus sp. P1XP2]|nr:hypothetical protein CM49_05939 [Paenibacillus sp. P1XP2]
MDSINAKNIANPPSRGMIFVCTFRAFGTSTAPIFIASFFTSGVNSSAKANDTIHPMMAIINMCTFNPHFLYRIELYSHQKNKTNPVFQQKIGFLQFISVFYLGFVTFSLSRITLRANFGSASILAARVGSLSSR